MLMPLRAKYLTHDYNRGIQRKGNGNSTRKPKSIWKCLQEGAKKKGKKG